MLAYYDTFSGLIPCKVLQITGDTCTIKLTAARGAYKRGEILTDTNRRYVWDRAKSFPKRGSYGQHWVVWQV